MLRKKLEELREHIDQVLNSEPIYDDEEGLTLAKLEELFKIADAFRGEHWYASKPFKDEWGNEQISIGTHEAEVFYEDTLLTIDGANFHAPSYAKYIATFDPLMLQELIQLAQKGLAKDDK